MKAVDLEILSKFGIQKFFVWGHEEGEKQSLRTGLWNFELFTELPSAPSPPSLSQRRRLAVRRHLAALP